MIRLLSFLLFTAATISAKDTLHVYIWADYIKPELVERFERDHDCAIVIDTFDSNESMYAKVRAGAAGYDLIVPSSYMVSLMSQQGLLSDLDSTKLPNRVNIDPEVLAKLDDRVMKHSVPYATSYGVLAFRKDRVKDAKPTWAMLDRVDLKQRMCLLNDMRETMGAALKFLGYSINTRDEVQLSKAGDVVASWKKNITKFDNEQYKTAIDSGEFFLVHGYSGDLFQVVAENDRVGILVPLEGAVMACDELVIPASARNPGLAHELINFLLDPQVSSENMEWTGYVCPNREAMKHVSTAFLQNPAVAIPHEVLAKCEVIQDLGADLPKYTKVWDQIKAAR